MSKIIFRLSKPSDLNSIVDLHYKIRKNYSIGFFSLMGRSFIKEYYRIILNDPYEIVVCAEENGIIRGFCSATLDVKKQFERMHKYKWRMIIGAIPTFLKSPNLIRQSYHRYKATQGEHDERFVPKNGARGEYWVWDPDYPNGLANAGLYNTHLKLLYALGVDVLQFEVDADNTGVLKFVIRNKAIESEKVTLPDGRERYIMYYKLKDKFSLNNK